VNALGTTRLVEAIAERRAARGSDPIVLVVSSAEVYGPAKCEPGSRPTPSRRSHPTRRARRRPRSERSRSEAHRLRIIVARPFPHIGLGQATRFVVPGFIERIRLAKQKGAPVVNTGNLEPVRDFLDVRDVVDAYIALLARGTSGEIYNVATGEGIRLEDLFT
jgi:GDP-4-dehydro-6-deoxy-D-mannose reductase